MDFLAEYEPDRRRIAREIQKALSGKPDHLYKAARHLTLSGGKMIRPMLCLMACEAVGGRREEAYRAAAAIEMTHTFTLVHDDIMDNDLKRRGRPSVHALYGIPTAILAGDLLFSKAYEVCDPRTVHILAEATSEICEGQEMDMAFEERRDVSEKEYLTMIKKKTAVLIEASMRSGAVVGGGSGKQIKALADYGLSLGMAFQIQDDVLGLTADERKLGKKVGNDIAEGKKNLIAIKGARLLKGDDRKRFLRILNSRKKTGRDIRTAITLLGACGAIGCCKKKADHYVDKAMASLSASSDPEARKHLRDMAHYIVRRDY